MKNKPIIAAVMSLLMLCSCGKAKVDLQESVTVSQTESTTVSEAEKITETETVSEAAEATETETTSETVTSETLMEISDYDMIPMLERATYREPPAALILGNMEFNLDLKDITPETDLFALTNMEKHSIGETFKMDLDGDGVEEEISVDEDFYKIEGKLRVFKVIINGKTYNLDRSHEGFMNVPTGIFTCDIDSGDNYIDIACTGSTATNDYLTMFYRYENGELRRIFDISYDTPDGSGESEMFFEKMNQSVTGKPIITDGSGVITAARRLDSQTWLAYSHYYYDSESGEIFLVCEPVYPYYYENINNFAAAKEFSSEYYNIEYRNISNPLLTEEIALYKEPDLNSETVTLTPQIIYFTAEYPYPVENPAAFGNGLCEWIYLVAEDGTTGWIRSYNNSIYIDEEDDNAYLYDVFSGLVLYD